MYVDPITSQTYEYATPIACNIFPKIITELDPDSDDQSCYILGPEPILKKHHSCSHLLKYKLEYDLIISLLKMLEYIPLHNFVDFGINFYFQNTVTLHFNS